MKSVIVNVFGSDYNVRADSDGEHVQEVARIVDRKMREIDRQFNQGSSTFKKALLTLDPDKEIVASQLGGEFVLPANPWQPCVLIAGGIGAAVYGSFSQRPDGAFGVFYGDDVHSGRDIRVRYKHSVLGALWAIIPPAATMFIFTFVFGTVVQINRQRQ